MITARDALALPTAALRPSDAEAAAEVLAIVEACVKKDMTRGGCIAPIDPSTLNPPIMQEVERTCRRLGWKAAFQQRIEQSPLTGQQIVTGVHLALQPSDEAYDAHDAVVKTERANGVAHP